MRKSYRQIPTNWTGGLLVRDGQQYHTLNPPRRASGPAPTPRPDKTYGPFLVRQVWTDGPPFEPPRPLGYIVLHPETGAQWWTVVYRSAKGARALADVVARAFDWPVWYPASEAATPIPLDAETAVAL